MNILIIKTGKTETFQDHPSHGYSIGDVFRTTFIVDFFLNDSIDWLSSSGYIFLTKNRSIRHVYLITEIEKINMESYDVIINLEKDAVMLEFLHLFRNKIIGFHGDNRNCFLPVGNNLHFFSKISLLLGMVWKGNNNYMYDVSSHDEYDIGLNFSVGKTWPTKKMSFDLWKRLDLSLRGHDFNTSFQKDFNNLEAYVEWIASCKIFITHDSLGFHIANALNKKIICLVGPTSPSELYLFNHGFVITANNIYCNKMPCYRSLCNYPKFCMDNIKIEDITDLVLELQYEGKY